VIDRGKFFARIRVGKLLGPVLDQSEVDGCEAVLDAMDDLPASWVAYALATAYHETAHTMRPIAECGGPKYFFRMYDKAGNRPNVAAVLGNVQAGDGAKFCGRGYVQLTGRTNYAKAGRELNVNLLANPDRAMEPGIAANVMRLGMTQGWFTGRRLRDYLPATGPVTRADFIQARRIINGQDRANDIADYAVQFMGALL